MIETDGRLDGAVHNATSGLSPRPTPLGELTMTDWQDHIAVSLRGSWLLARAAHPHLAASEGSYLLLTSEAGFDGKAKLGPYAGVKAAQRGFARALVREWGPDGIRVNCLAPLAKTPAMERAFELDAGMEARVTGKIPLGRVGDPTADVGPVARFLLSPDARYVTGNTLVADGGSCPIS